MTSLHFCSHGAALLVRWFGSGRRSELKGSKIAGQVKEAKGGAQQKSSVKLDARTWNGETFDSLSGIAFAITGTKWNGPRFFGLRDRRPHINAGEPE